jgi:predicted DNA-binding transcriptional regulator AlpA
MRSDVAAWYLGMSETSFLRLVEARTMPAGVPINGMLVWDRFDLDTGFENYKARRQARRNTVNELLGVNDDDPGD